MNTQSIHVYIHIYLYIHTYVYIYIYIHTCIYMYTYMSMYMFRHIYIFMCTCICICLSLSLCFHGRSRSNLKSLRLPKSQTSLSGVPVPFIQSFSTSSQNFIQDFAGVNGSPRHSKEWIGNPSNLNIEVSEV